MRLWPQTQTASAQAVPIDEGIDRGDRLPVFMPPTLFVLRAHHGLALHAQD